MTSARAWSRHLRLKHERFVNFSTLVLSQPFGNMMNDFFVPIRGSSSHASPILFAFLLLLLLLHPSLLCVSLVSPLDSLRSGTLGKSSIIWQSGIALHTVYLLYLGLAIPHLTNYSHCTPLPPAIWNCLGYLAPASRPSSLCEVLIRRKCTQYST